MLTVHPGTYADSGRISIGVKGSEDAPVVVRGAPDEPRPLITRAASASAQNTINIEGAQHLTLRHLEISGNGGDGVNLGAEPAHVILEDLHIHDVAVGVQLRSDMHHIVVRGNHIHSTQLTGEGIYVGCHDASCVVSESLFENNRIHDTTAASQGDGIEIKRGSHSNIVRGNVIYDTNYPCILLYGTDGRGRNVVEGNQLSECGEAAIQVAADTIVRNNVILNSRQTSILSQEHNGVRPGNLLIIHNTVVGDQSCLSVDDWSAAADIVFANNAVYCADDAFDVDRLTGVIMSGNVVFPHGKPLPENGYVVGQSATADFIDVGAEDLHPTERSRVRGAGNPRYRTTFDFDGALRQGPVDAGALIWREQKVIDANTGEDTQP